MNSRSKSTAAKHGLLIRAVFNFRKLSVAAGGRGPFTYPEFFRISLFKGPEIRLKSLMALLKKLVRPINAQTSRTELGHGQFLMTSVFASPGVIPDEALMS